MYFKDRKDAGQKLAKSLEKYKNVTNTVVLGLPRGGVIVAKEVARYLHLPLDIIVPRKIGAPQNCEFAIGAVAGDVVWLDPSCVAAVGASREYIDRTTQREKKEAQRRLELYRKDKPPQNFTNFTVILVDDGIATGSTMKVSIAYLKNFKIKKLIVAIPVGPPDTIQELQTQVDELVC